MHTIFMTTCFSLLFFCSLSAMDTKPVDQPEEKGRKTTSLETDDRRHAITKSQLKVEKPKRQVRSLSSEPKKIDLHKVEINTQPVKNPSPKLKRSFFSHHPKTSGDDHRIARDEKRVDEKKRAASSSPAKHKTLDFGNKLASSDPSVYGQPKLSPKKSPKKTITSSAPVAAKTSAVQGIDFMSARNAISARDIDSIRTYLCDEKNDPSKRDMYGNTLLHFIVLQTIASDPEDEKIYEILNLYLRNSRVDIFIKDKNNRAAFELFDDHDRAKYKKFYDVLIKHKNLTHIIHAMLIIKKNLTKKLCSRETITKEVEKVRKKITLHRISNYGTTPFMCNMIEYILETDKPTIQIMQDQYQKDPNYQDDEWKNTLCHLAAYLCDEKLIKELTSNPNVICDLQNKEKRDPRSLLEELEHKSLRTIFFNNVQSHRLINNATDTALLRHPMIQYSDISKTDDDWFIIIKKIFIELAQEIEQSQLSKNPADRDRALTKKSMLIPSDEFLLIVIQKYMKIKSQQTFQYSDFFNPNPSDEESSGTIVRRMQARAIANPEQFSQEILLELNSDPSIIETSNLVDIKDMIPTQTISIDLKQKK